MVAIKWEQEHKDKIYYRHIKQVNVKQRHVTINILCKQTMFFEVIRINQVYTLYPMVFLNLYQ